MNGPYRTNSEAVDVESIDNIDDFMKRMVAVATETRNKKQETWLNDFVKRFKADIEEAACKGRRYGMFWLHEEDLPMESGSTIEQVIRAALGTLVKCDFQWYESKHRNCLFEYRF